MTARYVSLVIILAAVFSGMLPAVSFAAPGDTHIDTDAGIRFTLPFALYQRKTPAQVENLIRDTFSGELARQITYSSAVYADGSDDFIVVWRQPHAQLPTRYDFNRLSVIAPLKSSGKITDVGIIESKAAATFAMDPAGPFKAQIALVLTRRDNVYIGYYSRTAEGTKNIAAVINSLEVDPGRIVRWSDLDSGLKPMWSGVIIAGGFLFGFLGWILFSAVAAPRRRPQKKSGGYSTPDLKFKSF